MPLQRRVLSLVYKHQSKDYEGVNLDTTTIVDNELLQILLI
jgi:hypothetical protein